MAHHWHIICLLPFSVNNLFFCLVSNNAKLFRLMCLRSHGALSENLLKLCWLMSWILFMLGFDRIDGIIRSNVTEGIEEKCTACRYVKIYLFVSPPTWRDHCGYTEQRQSFRPSDCSLDGNNYPWEWCKSRILQLSFVTQGVTSTVDSAWLTAGSLVGV